MSSSPKDSAVAGIRVGCLYGDDYCKQMMFGPHYRPETFSGNTDFALLLEDGGFKVSHLDLTPSYFRQEMRWNLRRYDVIFNAISDPDRNPKCLSIVQRLEKEAGVRFLNSPRQVETLTRDRVAEIARTIPGIHVPKTLRLDRPKPERAERVIGKAELRFPAILRPTGSHGGIGAKIVASKEEAIAALAPDESYYLTEFVNYRSNDGFFRKWRFYAIGDVVLVRALVVGETWNLHRRDRRLSVGGVDFVKEEAAVYRQFDSGQLPAIADMVRELARKMKLDFMGVDCCLTSAKSMILFEANATMTFGGKTQEPGRPHKQTRRPIAMAAARRLIMEHLSNGARATLQARSSEPQVVRAGT